MSAAYITCRELITFLADYLDGELPAEKNVEFERHLSVCISCRQYIATYRETIRMAKAAMLMPELRVEEAPADLITAILASIEGG